MGLTCDEINEINEINETYEPNVAATNPLLCYVRRPTPHAAGTPGTTCGQAASQVAN